MNFCLSVQKVSSQCPLKGLETSTPADAGLSVKALGGYTVIIEQKEASYILLEMNYFSSFGELEVEAKTWGRVKKAACLLLLGPCRKVQRCLLRSYAFRLVLGG